MRDRRRVWCPRCNGTLLAPSGPEPGSGVEPAPDGAGRRVRPRSAAPTAAGLSLDRRATGCGPATAPPAAATSVRLLAMRSFRDGVWWTISRPPEQQPAPAAQRPVGRDGAGHLIATMAVLGVAALVHVVRYALLIVNRIGAVEPVGGGWGDVAGCGASASSRCSWSSPARWC